MAPFNRNLHLKGGVDKENYFEDTFFIFCIEIISIAIANSKAKYFITKKGNTHYQEQYSDD